MYNPEDDLARYLLGETDAIFGESVINTPIDTTDTAVFIGGYVPFNEIQNELITQQLIVSVSTGTPNPRWLRDEWFINFRTVGRDKSYRQNCQTLINKVVDEFLGKSETKIENRLYLQFTFSELPSFVGFSDDTMPIYSATLYVVVEGLEDEFNRSALN